MTFCWNFIDLFIISISVALASRFNQINRRLIDSRFGAASKEKFWLEIRVHYYDLIDLVEEIDDEISMLILISTGNNLFSLCVGIFKSLTRYIFEQIEMTKLNACHFRSYGSNILDQLNFWISFGYLVFRLLSVLLSAASVNENSKMTKIMIRSAPSNKWNSDVRYAGIKTNKQSTKHFIILQLQRLSDTVRSDSIGLSGRRFFYITKALILAVNFVNHNM
jgi:gustatory receptor